MATASAQRLWISEESGDRPDQGYPAEFTGDQYLDVPPELIVEVLSPSDRIHLTRGRPPRVRFVQAVSQRQAPSRFLTSG